MTYHQAELIIASLDLKFIRDSFCLLFNDAFLYVPYLQGMHKYINYVSVYYALTFKVRHLLIITSLMLFPNDEIM
jgi:hypothetical protein